MIKWRVRDAEGRLAEYPQQYQHILMLVEEKDWKDREYTEYVPGIFDMSCEYGDNPWFDLVGEKDHIEGHRVVAWCELPVRPVGVPGELIIDEEEHEHKETEGSN